MLKTFLPTVSFFCFIVLIFFSCKQADPHNQLTQQEMEQGWILLFDGRTTSGWHLYNKRKTTQGWIVSNGTLAVDTFQKIEVNDLVSDLPFTNYELSFEWKLSKNGNSGVFINVFERPDITTAWATGPEYQLLDPQHADNAQPLKRAGSLFALAPQQNEVQAKGADQWNHSRIKQVDGNVEFFLNGVLTVQQNLASSEFQDHIQKSHFNNFPEFGKRTQGHIALQDWASGVAFRNIKIKPLP